jgi:hypothetical protein
MGAPRGQFHKVNTTQRLLHNFTVIVAGVLLYYPVSGEEQIADVNGIEFTAAY